MFAIYRRKVFLFSATQFPSLQCIHSHFYPGPSLPELFHLMQVFCRQPFFSLKRESKVNQREKTSHGEPMSRTLWWLPDLRIPQHGQTHARRQRTQTHTHTETNARSIFIVFGSAAVYVLPSLSAPHTLQSKNKNLYYRPASVTTIILLKQPLKTNYICTVFSSDCSGWAMLTGWVGFPFSPQTPSSRFTVCCMVLLMTGLSLHDCVLSDGLTFLQKIKIFFYGIG